MRPACIFREPDPRNLAREYVQKNDPIERDKRRMTRGFALSKAGDKDRAIAKHGARRAYVDPKTRRRCDSRVYVQVEHLVARAHGGGDEQTNLSCLCGPHNRLAWRAARNRPVCRRATNNV